MSANSGVVMQVSSCVAVLVVKCDGTVMGELEQGFLVLRIKVRASDAGRPMMSRATGLSGVCEREQGESWIAAGGLLDKNSMTMMLPILTI